MRRSIVISAALLLLWPSSVRAQSWSLAALGHDLDGAPQYLASSIVTNAFTLSATSFSLGQNQKKAVTLKGAIPGSQRSIYFGVLAEYARAGATQGSSVET